MKQIEKAAEKYALECQKEEGYPSPMYDSCDAKDMRECAFKSGAEWQAKQSPWISMKERLPEDTNEKLVMLVDGTIRIAHYDEDYNEDMEYHFWYDCAASESYHRDDVIYWMPIPSFDEILEANKDVLERIKEKGD